MKRNREIIQVNLSGRKTHHIQRKVKKQKKYGLFLIGSAFIYGEDRIVKRSVFMPTWRIFQRGLDLATDQAVDDYEANA